MIIRKSPKSSATPVTDGVNSTDRISAMTISGNTTKQLPGKKGIFRFRNVMLFFIVFIAAMAVYSMVGNDDTEIKAAAAKTSASAEPDRVDASTVQMVKDVCTAKLDTVAAKSGREIGNVKPKPYAVTSVSFTGGVKKVDLGYDRGGFEVPVTWIATTPEGAVSTRDQVCQYRELQKDATMLNR